MSLSRHTPGKATDPPDFHKAVSAFDIYGTEHGELSPSSFAYDVALDAEKD